MTASSLYCKVGDIQFPLVAADVEATQSLGAVDAVCRRLLDWFKAAVNAEMGDAWRSLTATLPDQHQLYNKNPIENCYPFRPQLRELEAGAPALFLYRTEQAFERTTMEIDSLVQQWECHYVLGKLDVGQISKFEKALQLVPMVIRATLKEGSHPAYDSGYVQLGSGAGGLLACSLMNSKSGQAAFGSEDKSFFATLMTLETKEALGYADGLYPDFEGTAFEMGVGDSEGIIPSLISLEASTTP